MSGHRGPRPTSFNGRAGRAEWVRAMIFGSIAAACLASLPGLWRMTAIPMVVMIGAVTLRRMHDLSWPSWILVVVWSSLGVAIVARQALGLPLAGSEIDQSASAIEIVMLAIEGVAILGWVALMFFLAVVPGRAGPNAFGEADAD